MAQYETVGVRCPKLGWSEKGQPAPPSHYVKARGTALYDWIRWYCPRDECGMHHLHRLPEEKTGLGVLR